LLVEKHAITNGTLWQQNRQAGGGIAVELHLQLGLPSGGMPGIDLARK
jgi:hypothetical protein